MAKNDKAKVRMTVIHFETESDNLTLQENIRTISHTLTRALTASHRVISPAGQLPSGNGSAEVVQEIGEQDVLDEDRLDSPVASQAAKKKGPARQYPTPQAIDLDLTSGNMPLKKFLEEKNPDGDIKRYLAIAYWLRKYRDIEDVTMHHAYTCYRHMGTGWQVPPDAAAPLRAMKRKQYGWMKAGSMKGAYAINHLGETKSKRCRCVGLIVELEDIVNSIPGFTSWKDADKIRFFAWFLHSQKGRERFGPGDIRARYDELSLQKPSDVNPYLNQMLNRRPREVLRDVRGYALEKRVKDQLEKKYGQRFATVQADKLLLELPAKIPDLAERTFLDEAVRCFRCKAFRAAIVMTWNLAYDHLCLFVFNTPNRLLEFNTQLPKSFPKARISAVNTRDDFSELKESGFCRCVVQLISYQMIF